MAKSATDEWRKAGGLKKIADLPKVCGSRSHEPPNMMVYQPGTWQWTCPDCGETTTFTVGWAVWR